MIHWAWLILALIVGGIVGMGTTVLCVAASWEGDRSIPKISDDSSYFLTPENAEITLAECPVGLFEYEGTLGMKTEYCTNTITGTKIDAYIVSTGERCCIDNYAMVKPCSIWVADGGDE